MNRAAGAAIIALALFFIASLFVTRINREWRPQVLVARAGAGGPIVAGAAFALAWTPCVGPTLGAILGLASTQSTGQAAGLLAVYSAGLALPFLFSAFIRHRSNEVATEWGVTGLPETFLLDKRGWARPTSSARCRRLVCGWDPGRDQEPGARLAKGRGPAKDQMTSHSRSALGAGAAERPAHALRATPHPAQTLEALDCVVQRAARSVAPIP